MTVRRVFCALPAIVVAVVVALAVPVSQLRLVSTRSTCCCADPAHCHCPDHKASHSKQPTVRVCHRSGHDSVAQELPSFTPPRLALAAPAPRVAPASFAMPRLPHAPPLPAQPYGPS